VPFLFCAQVTIGFSSKSWYSYIFDTDKFLYGICHLSFIGKNLDEISMNNWPFFVTGTIPVKASFTNKIKELLKYLYQSSLAYEYSTRN
jgi:hypothetical protein